MTDAIPNGPMQVLTIWQPWATAYMLGPKDVENRSPRWSWLARRCPFPMAVHAAARQPDFHAMLTVDERWPGGRRTDALRRSGWPQIIDVAGWLPRIYPRGHILGVVEVVEVVPASKVESEWAVDGQLCLVSGRRWVLPTLIPHKGRQGIGALPEDLAALVRAEARPWEPAREGRR